MLHGKLAGRLYRHAGLRLFRLFSRPLEPRPGTALAGLEMRLVSMPDVLSLGGDPELNLRPEVVAAAYVRGDLCAAAFDGSTVVGYCWLAFAPLPHLDGVWVRFGRPVAWTYKSLVRASYRGRGIAPALYRFADAQCRERDRDHSLICVESHNRPSVSAALRAGYAPSGSAGYLLRGSRLLAWSSPAARVHDVSFFLPASGLA